MFTGDENSGSGAVLPPPPPPAPPPPPMGGSSVASTGDSQLDAILKIEDKAAIRAELKQYKKQILAQAQALRREANALEIQIKESSRDRDQRQSRIDELERLIAQAKENLAVFQQSTFTPTKQKIVASSQEAKIQAHKKELKEHQDEILRLEQLVESLESEKNPLEARIRAERKKLSAIEKQEKRYAEPKAKKPVVNTRSNRDEYESELTDAFYRVDRVAAEKAGHEIAWSELEVLILRAQLLDSDSQAEDNPDKLVENILFQAILQERDDTPLGPTPRARIAEILGYDIVTRHAERKQQPKPKHTKKLSVVAQTVQQELATDNTGDTESLTPAVHPPQPMTDLRRSSLGVRPFVLPSGSDDDDLEAAFDEEEKKEAQPVKSETPGAASRLLSSRALDVSFETTPVTRNGASRKPVSGQTPTGGLYLSPHTASKHRTRIAQAERLSEEAKKREEELAQKEAELKAEEERLAQERQELARRMAMEARNKQLGDGSNTSNTLVFSTPDKSDPRAAEKEQQRAKSVAKFNGTYL